jgi:hypothetical protein
MQLAPLSIDYGAKCLDRERKSIKQSSGREHSTAVNTEDEDWNSRATGQSPILNRRTVNGS